MYVIFEQHLVLSHQGPPLPEHSQPSCVSGFSPCVHLQDAASKSKDKGVWPFSDPSGDTILPQSMAEVCPLAMNSPVHVILPPHQHVRGYTRVSEMEHVTSVVDSNRFQLEDVVTKLTDAEKLYLRQKKLKLAPRKQVRDPPPSACLHTHPHGLVLYPCND